MGLDAMILVFWLVSFKLFFSLSSFTLNKMLFSSSSVSAIRVVSSAHLRLLIFLPAILIPAFDWTSLAFHMMYFAYKLNKQDDNTALMYSFPNFEPVCCTMSGSNCASWPAYRFLRRQVGWYFHFFKNFPQFVAVTHTVKGFSIVNEAEADDFSETPLLSPWCNECWQFDLWFLCLF